MATTDLGFRRRCQLDFRGCLANGIANETPQTRPPLHEVLPSTAPEGGRPGCQIGRLVEGVDAARGCGEPVVPYEGALADTRLRVTRAHQVGGGGFRCSVHLRSHHERLLLQQVVKTLFSPPIY